MPFSDFMFVLFGKRGIFAPPVSGDDFLPFDPEAKAVEGHLHRDEAETIDRTVGTYTVQVHGLRGSQIRGQLLKNKNQRIQRGIR